MWRLNERIAIRTKPVVPKLIGHEEQYVRAAEARRQHGGSRLYKRSSRHNDVARATFRRVLRHEQLLGTCTLASVMLDFHVYIPLSRMRKDWLRYVTPGIRFSGTKELRIERIFRGDLESDLRTPDCLVPVVIHVDAERNRNTRLHDRRRFETDGVISIALSESQAKPQEQKRKDLHVFSVGPAIGYRAIQELAARPRTMRCRRPRRSRSACPEHSKPRGQRVVGG